METLEKAITNWAKKQVNNQVPLYIYLLSHNLGDKFLLEKTDTQEKYLLPQLLDTWLDQLPEGTPVTVVIEACYSGNFISQDGIKSALVDKDRTIVVSASGDKQAKIARSSSFSRTFFSLIESNETISNAFEQAAQKMERMVYHRGQSPQIESSGDGNPNQREDYLTLEDSYLPANIISLAAPPNITTITQPTELEKGISSQRIEVELIGADVSRVYATVIPPSFDPKAEISSWNQLKFSEFDLGKVSDGKYAATYANFTTPGSYSVVINAENADGFADPVQTTITVPSEVSKPEPQKLTGDVNGDGTVNIFDLVIAAGSFGKTGDGIIDKTWTDAWSYYFGASYAVNDKNRFELYAIGAPQRHGQNLYKQNMGVYDPAFAKDQKDYDPTAIDKEFHAPEDIDGYSGDPRLYNQNWAPVNSSYKGKKYWYMYGARTVDRHNPNSLCLLTTSDSADEGVRASLW
mgnify:CR=1 FL=1